MLYFASWKSWRDRALLLGLALACSGCAAGRSGWSDEAAGKALAQTILQRNSQVVDATLAGRFVLESEKGAAKGSLRIRYVSPDIYRVDVIASGVAGAGGGGFTALESHSANGMTFSREVVRDHWRLPDWLLYSLNARSGNLAAFPVQGDSMSPTLLDGDVVFVDTRTRQPSPPGLFVLADEFGGVIVKRLEVSSSPGDEDIMVRVGSDNPHHMTKELRLDEISIVGRYVGRFTR